MANVAIYSDRVVIRLSAAEKTLAFRRKDIVLNRAAISSAVITDDPWVWLRGVRAPGAHLPGKLAIGTWRGHGGREFVLMRKGKPAVVIDFTRESDANTDPSPDGEATNENTPDEVFDDFVRVIVSTAHAADLIRALRVDDSGGVFAAGA